MRLNIFAGIALLASFLIISYGFFTRQSDPWRLANVTGHLPDLHFSLIDDSGRQVTERTFRGVVLLYFGFTGCSSECPVAMARLAHVLQQLGHDADALQVLFVSVDPAHDTPQALRHYLQAFDTRHMSGLTGDANAIEALAKQYRTAYRRDYDAGAITHGDAVYLFDKRHHARLIAMAGDPDAALIADIQRLLREL